MAFLQSPCSFDGFSTISRLNWGFLCSLQAPLGAFSTVLYAPFDSILAISRLVWRFLCWSWAFTRLRWFSLGCGAHPTIVMWGYSRLAPLRLSCQVERGRCCYLRGLRVVGSSHYSKFLLVKAPILLVSWVRLRARRWLCCG